MFNYFEYVRVSKILKEMAQETGEMLEIRKLAENDEQFLNALAAAANTSREIVDLISMEMLIPIGNN